MMRLVCLLTGFILNIPILSSAFMVLHRIRKPPNDQGER